MTVRPNILWLMSDELRPEGGGCYGSEWGAEVEGAVSAGLR